MPLKTPQDVQALKKALLYSMSLCLCAYIHCPALQKISVALFSSRAISPNQPLSVCNNVISWGALMTAPLEGL